jgi:hypothetical protein
MPTDLIGGDLNNGYCCGKVLHRVKQKRLLNKSIVKNKIYGKLRI